MVMKKIDAYLHKEIQHGTIPGAVFAAGDCENVYNKNTYGKRRLMPHNEAMTADTVFDLASLTKVVGTWAGAIKLLERGEWRLDMTVEEIDPSVSGAPVAPITIEQLLTHTGGLPERTWLIQYGREKEQIYRGICDRTLDWTPGTHVAYSNRGFILLGLLIEKTTGKFLSDYISEEIWIPCGMKRTLYNPKGFFSVAPTELDEKTGKYICGSVHDENAQVLGGVAGHAGVFSDVDDLCRFCRMIVRGGEIDGRQVLSRAWVENSFRNYTSNLNEGRGLGWQKCPGENAMFRHFGFTGTTIWIDCAKKTWAVLLTNRVHPNREIYASGIQQIRAAVLAMLLDL